MQKSCVIWYFLLLSLDTHLPEPHLPLPFSQSSWLPTTPVSLVSWVTSLLSYHVSCFFLLPWSPQLPPFSVPSLIPALFCIPAQDAQHLWSSSRPHLGNRGQAGRQMHAALGGEVLPSGSPSTWKKINTNYERTCVFRLPVLTACGMSLLPRVAMGQDLFTQVLRKQNPLKESKHYPASIHAGSNWPAVGHWSSDLLWVGSHKLIKRLKTPNWGRSIYLLL